MMKSKPVKTKKPKRKSRIPRRHIKDGYMFYERTRGWTRLRFRDIYLIETFSNWVELQYEMKNSLQKITQHMSMNRILVWMNHPRIRRINLFYAADKNMIRSFDDHTKIMVFRNGLTYKLRHHIKTADFTKFMEED